MTNTNEFDERKLIHGGTAHNFTEEDRIKGGQSQSSVKRFHVILNGLLARKDLTENQKTQLALLRSGEYTKIFDIHLAKDLLYAEDLENSGEKDKALAIRKLIDDKILRLYGLFPTAVNNKSCEPIPISELYVHILKRPDELK